MKPDHEILVSQSIFLPIVETSKSSFKEESKAGWLKRLARYHRNYKTRQQLRSLDEHLLKDIGLTIDEYRAEVKKFFWQD